MTDERANAPAVTPGRSAETCEEVGLVPHSTELAELRAQLDAARSAIVNAREAASRLPGADFRWWPWRHLRSFIGKPGDPMPWEVES